MEPVPPLVGVWRLHHQDPQGSARCLLGTSRASPPPAVRETWVPSLGRENPLEEGMETYSNILA